MSDACENTDREIWREREGDYYADSIHVTKAGGIGLNVGGRVIVMSIQDWHKLGLILSDEMEKRVRETGAATQAKHKDQLQ